jgi:cytochrome c oxidase subunit 2
MEGIIDLHNYIFGYLIFVLCLVLWVYGTTLYFFWWYPNCENMNFRKKVLKSRSVLHSTVLETGWTLAPSGVLILIGIPSFALLYGIDEVINPQMTIKVVGHQWYWSYEYSIVDLSKLEWEESDFGEKHPPLKEDSHVLNRILSHISKKINIAFDSYMKDEDELEEGEARLLSTTEPLVVPVNTQIRFLVTSADVIHSFAVPSLGIKIDAIPGRLNQGMVYIKVPGIYRGQCSEICGVNHGFMPIEIKAVEGDQFLCWYLVKSITQ